MMMERDGGYARAVEIIQYVLFPKGLWVLMKEDILRSILVVFKKVIEESTTFYRIGNLNLNVAMNGRGGKGDSNALVNQLWLLC